MASLTCFRSVCFGVVLVFASGCAKKSDPIAAANTFFSALRHGDVQAAYDHAAFSFQAQQGFANFQTEINELGLVDYINIQWTPRQVTPDEASFEGVITCRSGVNVPVTVTLVPEAGDWKVYALRTTAANAANPVSNRFSVVGKSPRLVIASRENVPSEKSSIALVQETFARIDDALRQKDFSDLYHHMSGAWQQQFSVKRLEEIFKPMVVAGGRLDAAQTVEPIFAQPPYLNEAGLLVVRGYFPTQPHRLTFSFLYIYELPKWKLIEIQAMGLEN